MSDAAKAEPEANGQREQSTIQFPYGDLNDAMSIAQGMIKCGGRPCAPDQLAAAMGLVPGAGGFKTKIATARTFGVIETIRGQYHLTDLGFGITDRNLEKRARADAFLNVPLYRRLYEDFRNRQLPPSPAPLERTFISYGVAPKQADKARMAFQRSAQQAGYFDQGGKDRLVRPIVGGDDQPSSSIEQDDFGGGGGDGPNGGDLPKPVARGGASARGYAPLHPFVQGLLDTLPEPETNWTVEGRAKWLQAAANIFDLMYKGDGNITVTAAESKKAAAGQELA
jgi:hypothetical protein